MSPSEPSDPVERASAAVLAVLLVAACVGWYFLWVRPRDAFLGEVIDCVGDDPTREAFAECEELVRRAHGR